MTVHIETEDEASFEDFVDAASRTVESFDFSTSPAVDIGTVTITESECVLDGGSGLTVGQRVVTVSNEITNLAAA